MTSIKYVRTNRNLSDILTKYKAFNQDFSDVFWHGYLDEESSPVEIRLVPIQTGDELRIFCHSQQEESQIIEDSQTIK